MKQGNRISETLSAADAQKAVDLLRQVEKLLPFLITLTPDESRSLRNIGFDGVLSPRPPSTPYAPTWTSPAAPSTWQSSRKTWP